MFTRRLSLLLLVLFSLHIMASEKPLPFEDVLSEKTFIQIELAVIDENNEPLKNKNGEPLTFKDYYIVSEVRDNQTMKLSKVTVFDDENIEVTQSVQYLNNLFPFADERSLVNFCVQRRGKMGRIIFEKGLTKLICQIKSNNQIIWYATVPFGVIQRITNLTLKNGKSASVVERLVQFRINHKSLEPIPSSPESSDDQEQHNQRDTKTFNF
ncbi:MAG: hypothetical protein RMK80_06700 [Pseudobdellovibrionaceae bacterium]|nr:hypothetical protein [Pseudobdellovibrionaceae bacterium]